ncbi:MAG TPA: glutathione S-transferase family protein [Candidatus Dormibacteraeota bacterium]|nr:glutathione S-transferase family protein [Candidatus Dormibacteraeota bacterium]
MKLYDSQTAPNPRRVRVFLAEKGIAVPIEQVDITMAVNRGPEFRAKNPLGTVPVLELDDGTCISESVAICRYFEETQPTPPLMGVDARDRAVVEMWQRRMELELFIPVAQVFRNSHPFFAGRIPQVAEWGEVSRKHAEATMAWLDRELAGREFIAGPRYTIADVTALCGIDFGRVSKIRIAPEHANLSRWHAAVSARPSARA